MSQAHEPSSTPDLASLSREIAALRLDQERRDLDRQKREIEESKKTPPPKPWWISAVEILALPAAVIAIVVQLTNATSTVQTTAKTEAETAKIRVEEVKTRVELQKILDDLAETKKKGVVAYREEIEKTIPQLQSAVERLRALEVQSQSATLGRSIAKYVLLWILFHFIGLIFDIVSQIWNTVISALVHALANIRHKTRDGRDDYERQRRLHIGIQWASLALYPVPSVLRWSLQLSIFFALVVPLFNEISVGIGAGTSFDVVVQQTKAIDFAAALTTMKQILFGTP